MQVKSECVGTRIFCLGASRCGRGARSGAPRVPRPAVAHKRRGGRSRPSNGEAASRSAADRTAVVLGDDHDRRSRRHPVLEVRPAARGFLEGRREAGRSPGCCGATNKVRPSGVNSGPHISAPLGQAKKNLTTARPAPSTSQQYIPSGMLFLAWAPPWSVEIQSRPCRIDRDVVGRGEPGLAALAVHRARAFLGRVAGQEQHVPAELGRRHGRRPAPSPGGTSSTIWPWAFSARGFGPSTCSALRRVLLVSATYTRPLTGFGSTSSGRSIGVAPTRSAALRVKIRTSAWLGKPFSAVSGPSPWTSGSQVTLSSSNLAT